MALADTHCHLDMDQFADDRPAVIERAAQGGVTHILVPSITVGSSRDAVHLAETNAMLYAAVGVHPNDTESWDGQTISALNDLAAESLKVVAVGEIGLDYYWSKAPPEQQRSIFKEQLELAADLELPVIIHSREAGNASEGQCADDLLLILGDWVAGLHSAQKPLAQRPGVLHSFAGSLRNAQRALELGFYLGVTGPITYKNAEPTRKLVAGLPLERLLIETDSPYLSPEPHRGARNEPAFVVHIAEKIAEVQGRTPAEIARATTANAAALFSWAESS